MKSSNIEIIDFSQGEISQYILQKNTNYNVTNSCHMLSNMIVDNNKNIVRRPGTTHISKLEINPVKIYSFELKNKSVILNFFDKVLEIYVFKSEDKYKKQTLETYFEAKALSHSLSIVYSSENQELFIFSEKFHPGVLKFASNLNATLDKLYFIDGPYLNEDKNNITLTISDADNTKLLVNVKANKDIFNFDYVNRYIKIKQGNTWGSVKITRLISAYTVEAKIIKQVTQGTSSIFKLGAFGIDVGYPKQGLLFENRLYLLGNHENPGSIYISKYGNLLDFSDSEIIKDKNTDIKIDRVLYDSAISFTIANSNNNTWLAASKNSVLVGSEKGIYSIARQDPNQALSPYNITIKQVSYNECSDLFVISDIGIIFTDFSKRHIYIADITQDTMISILKINNLSLHLFISQIKRIFLTKSPFYILWVILEDGTLLSASIIEGNFAWSRHNLHGIIQDITSSYLLTKSYLGLIVKREETCTSLEFMYLEEIYMCYFQDICYLDCKTNAVLKQGLLEVSDIYNRDKISAFDAYTKQEFNNIAITSGKGTVSNQNTSSSEVLVGYGYVSTYKTPSINIPGSLSTIHLGKSIQNIIINASNVGNISISNNSKSNVIYRSSFTKTEDESNSNNIIIINPCWNMSNNQQIEISQNSSHNFSLYGLRILLNI